MHGLIDSDSMIYAAGFTAQSKTEEGEIIAESADKATMYLDMCVEQATRHCTSCVLILSPPKTFRNKFDSYKAQRVSPKPVHYEVLRNHLIDYWQAEVAEGIEADDVLSIEGWRAWKRGGALPLLVHIDKDINTVPGMHYNPRMDIMYELSEEEAIKNFWIQMLMGDTADNIQGIPGCGEIKAKKILDESDDWEATVRELYQIGRQDYDKNYTLLYLLREEPND